MLTAAGMHAIEGAKVSDIQGVVLHFKYFQDFVDRTFEEAGREKHAGGAKLYKSMARKLKDNVSPCFCYSGSVKFHSSGQLVDMGMMISIPEYEEYCKRLSREDASCSKEL